MRCVTCITCIWQRGRPAVRAVQRSCHHGIQTATATHLKAAAAALQQQLVQDEGLSLAGPSTYCHDANWAPDLGKCGGRVHASRAAPRNGEAIGAILAPCTDTAVIIDRFIHEQQHEPVRAWFVNIQLCSRWISPSADRRGPPCQLQTCRLTCCT